MKAAFYTLGCKVNQYETQAMREQLLNQGYEIVKPEHHPDVFIVNSCTVTAESDRKTRQMVRRFRQQLPDAVIVLTGCMPQAFPEKMKDLDVADVVIGNASGTDLNGAIHRFLSTGNRVVEIIPHKKGEQFHITPLTNFEGHTRAFLKIEDGCDRFCSYCIIPTARGRVRSKPLDEIRRETQSLADSGYQEIVLVGINLSAYGKGTPLNLCDAVDTVSSIDGISRVRLGSMEPDQFTDEMILRLANQAKFCPHFHLSLQSGCSRTLTKMNRHYDTVFYRNLVNRIRDHFPSCAITTDVMVGFPGESSEDFETSLQFVREMQFADAHVFPYSRRDGTPAASSPDQVPRAVREQRSKEMMKCVKETRILFLQKQLEPLHKVLFERMLDENTAEGYTENYIKVHAKANPKVCGQILPVKLIKIYPEFCSGGIL